MLGRGLVADPGLALAIRDPAAPPLAWDAVFPLVQHYWQRIAGHVSPRHRAGRLKQWLQQLKRTHAPAESLWQRLRTENDPRVVQRALGLPEALVQR
jgi:tRNA-dihydrouridine synthase C